MHQSKQLVQGPVERCSCVKFSRRQSLRAEQRCEQGKMRSGRRANEKSHGQQEQRGVPPS